MLFNVFNVIVMLMKCIYLLKIRHDLIDPTLGKMFLLQELGGDGGGWEVGVGLGMVWGGGVFPDISI